MSKKLLLLSIATVLLGCACSKKTDSVNNEINDIKLSYKARAAIKYIQNELPAEQRDVLMGRSYDKDAEASAIANLIQSGHLDGFAEYIEAMEKQK